jgi:DNA-binding MarR family transcriptional regulator
MQLLPNRFPTETKIRIAAYAETLCRSRRQPGKVTGKDLDVLKVLLQSLGAAMTTAELATAAYVAQSSVSPAIKSLEAAGLLSTQREGRVLRAVTLIVPQQSVRVLSPKKRFELATVWEV